MVLKNIIKIGLELTKIRKHTRGIKAVHIAHQPISKPTVSEAPSLR